MPSKKILLLIVSCLVLLLIGGAILYRSLKSEKNEVQRQAEEMLNKNGEFNNQNTDAQVAELKEAVLYLATEVGKIQGLETAQSGIPGMENRVVSPNITGSLSGNSAELLLRINSLEEKVAALESKSGVSSNSTSTSTKSSVQYIPLGSGAEITDRNGTTLSSFEVTLDPADFPNYTTIQLEAVVRMAEISGTLSLNLYNYTDKRSITNSDINTNSTSFITANSFGFRLDSGRKTYRIWAKSSEGYITYIQSARLRVNY